METINTNGLTMSVLHDFNKDLGERMEGDCVFINSALFPPLDDEFRVALEEIKKGSNKDHLIVMLQTNGGLMETVERLVAVMRTHYRRVSFVIPNFAYSAGTVLTLSGDSIFMDYYSVLGPIDPQIPSKDGQYQLSGLGILRKFDETCDKINGAESDENCRAELAYLVKHFEPEQLFAIEQARQYGISLITEWLPRYKFKDWKKTKKNGDTVVITEDIRITRAKKIAETLGNPSIWHSHGRGISILELSRGDLKLKIDNFGKDKALSQTIRHYHGLAVDHFRKAKISAYIHSKLGFRIIA